jgi:hypothetical protein
VVLVLVLVFPAAVCATGGSGNVPGDRPVIYTIEGYLDHAPGGTIVQEHILLGAAGHNRRFLLTGYQRAGDGNPWTLVRTLHAYQPDFLLVGRAGDIASILDAPAGSHVRGTFQYLQDQHLLVINPYDLEVD